MNFSGAKYLASFGVIDQLPKSKRCEVAFAGRSNVGKSSLLNALLGRSALAKVSCKPGKTQTINFFEIDACDFVDLPGYGYAKVAKTELERWADLIEGYFNQERKLALAIALVDIRHAPSELDKKLIRYLEDMEIDFAIALTKSDKLSKQKAQNQKRLIEKELDLDARVQVVVTSSVKKTGIEKIKQLIAEHV